jgi:cell division septation protein DedD
MKPEISPDFQDYKYYKYYHAYGDETEGRKGRLSGWGLSFLRRKGGSLEKIRKNNPIGHVGKRSAKGGSKGVRVLKLSLFVVGLVFLTGGILWHNGMIDPSELPFFQDLFQKNESKHLVKKTRPEKNIMPSIGNGPTSTPPNTVRIAIVEERAHPIKKRIPKHQTGTKAPTPIEKDKLKMNPATARVDFSEEITIAVPQPKRDATKDRPSIEKDRGREKVVPETKRPMMNPVMVHQDSINDADMIHPERRPLPAKNPNTLSPWTIPSESKNMLERPESGSRTEITPYPYSLYLGSFKTPRLVKKAISFYLRKGLSPYWSKVEFKEKGVWFRVFTGHFKDSEEAEKFKVAHDLRGAEVKRTGYANLIGVYSDAYELADIVTKLKSLGYSPYIIPGQPGCSRLFLGAYITREGAEQYSEDLKESGIEVRVVTR